MKTAISIPDDVFQRATRYAKKLGISRSELIARAVEQFLEEHRAREIRESYDRAFGDTTADEPDDTVELRARAARKALLDVEW